MLEIPNNSPLSKPTCRESFHKEIVDGLGPDEDSADKYLLSDELRAAIAAGWQATYSLLFDKPERAFVANLGPHHRRAIKWHWASRHRICRTNQWESAERKSFVKGEGLTQTEFEDLVNDYLANHRPKYYAYFPIWSRGHMKSTVARRIAVVDALISMYYGQPGYCLYFSGTDKKTENHARSIETLLASVAYHAPALARVKRSDEGNRQLGWKASFLNTAAGYVYHFGSLQSGLAGANLDDIRPTMMVPDDIDDRKDSAVISQKNFDLLTTEILPMGSKGTLTLWAQNLISRFSSMYRIHKGIARVLTNRMPAKPIPAIIGLKTEVRTVDGTPRDVIIAGVPTWPYFNIQDCQDEINRIGLPAFLRECQHEVEQSREGLMLKNYEDKVHPISESEFASKFGSLEAWRPWAKWIFGDWARTKTQFHANVAGFMAVSSQNGQLPGFKFLFHPMSFPAAAAAEDVAERVLGLLSKTSIAEGDKKAYTWAELRKDTLLRANALAHTNTTKDRLEFEHKVMSEIIPKYSRPVLERFNVRGGTYSHSEDTIRKLFRRVYGIHLSPSNPGEFDSIDDIDRDLMVDYAEPHAFRPGQLGYSRFAIVCPDWKDCPPDQIRVDERTGAKIYPPKPPPDDLSPDELHDHDLIRFQFLNWRTRAPKLTETGETVDAVLKLNDDFGQALQMLYHSKQFTNVALPTDRVVEAHLPQTLTEEALEAAPEEQKANVLQGRLKKMREIEQQLKKPVVSVGISRIRRR